MWHKKRSSSSASSLSGVTAAPTTTTLSTRTAQDNTSGLQPLSNNRQHIGNRSHIASRLFGDTNRHPNQSVRSASAFAPAGPSYTVRGAMPASLHPQRTLRNIASGSGGGDDDDDEDDDFRVTYDLHNTRAVERLREQLLQQRKEREQQQQQRQDEELRQEQDQEQQEDQQRLQKQQDSTHAKHLQSQEELQAEQEISHVAPIENHEKAQLSQPMATVLDEGDNSGDDSDDVGNHVYVPSSLTQVMSARRSPRLQERQKKREQQLSSHELHRSRPTMDVVDLTTDEFEHEFESAGMGIDEKDIDVSTAHLRIRDESQAEEMSLTPIDDFERMDHDDSMNGDDDDDDDFEKFFGSTFSPPSRGVRKQNDTRSSSSKAKRTEEIFPRRTDNDSTRSSRQMSMSQLRAPIMSPFDVEDEDIRDNVSIGSFSDEETDTRPQQPNQSSYLSPLSFTRTQKSPRSSATDSDIDYDLARTLFTSAGSPVTRSNSIGERRLTPSRAKRVLDFSQATPGRPVIMTPPEARVASPRSSHLQNSFVTPPRISVDNQRRSSTPRKSTAKRLFADMDDTHEEIDDIVDDDSPFFKNAETIEIDRFVDELHLPHRPQRSPPRIMMQSPQQPQPNQSPRKEPLSNTAWLDKAMSDSDLMSNTHSPVRATEKYPRVRRDTKWRAGGLADKAWKLYSTMPAHDTMFQHRMDSYRIAQRMIEVQQEQHSTIMSSADVADDRETVHDTAIGAQAGFPFLSAEMLLPTSSISLEQNAIHDNPYNQCLELKIICCLEEPHAYITTCKVMYCSEDETCEQNGSQQEQISPPHEGEYVDVVFSYTAKEILELLPGKYVRIFAPWHTISACPPSLPRRVIVGSNFFENANHDVEGEEESDMLDDPLFDLEKLQGDFSHPLLSEIEKDNLITASQLPSKSPRRRRPQSSNVPSRGIMTQFSQHMTNNTQSAQTSNGATRDLIHNRFQDIYKQMPMFPDMDRRFSSITIRGVLQRKMVRRISDPVLGNCMIMQECNSMSVILISVPTDFEQTQFWSNHFAEGYVYTLSHLKLEKKTYVRSGTDLYGVVKDLFSSPSSTLEIYNASVKIDTICTYMHEDPTVDSVSEMPSARWLTNNVTRSPMYVPDRKEAVRNLIMATTMNPVVDSGSSGNARLYNRCRVTLESVDILFIRHIDQHEESILYGGAQAVLFVQDQESKSNGSVLPVFVVSSVVIQDIFDIIEQFMEQEKQQCSSKNDDTSRDDVDLADEVNRKPLVRLRNLVVCRDGNNSGIVRICMDSYSCMEHSGTCIESMTYEKSLVNLRQLSSQQIILGQQHASGLQFGSIIGKFIRVLRDGSPRPFRAACANCHSNRLASDNRSCLDCGTYNESCFFQLHLEMEFEVQRNDGRQSNDSDDHTFRMIVDHSTVEDMMQRPMELSGCETNDEAEHNLVQKDVTLLCLVTRPPPGSLQSPLIETIGSFHLTMGAWESLYLRLFNRHEAEQMRQRRPLDGHESQAAHDDHSMTG